MERLWVEVNQRVNYPIKEALNALVEGDQLDMEDDITRFSISWVTTRLCQEGIQHCVTSWNHHHIPSSNFNCAKMLMYMIIKHLGCCRTRHTGKLYSVLGGGEAASSSDSVTRCCCECLRSGRRCTKQVQSMWKRPCYQHNQSTEKGSSLLQSSC